MEHQYTSCISQLRMGRGGSQPPVLGKPNIPFVWMLPFKPNLADNNLIGDFGLIFS
jgi:hypothetical protein